MPLEHADCNGVSAAKADARDCRHVPVGSSRRGFRAGLCQGDPEREAGRRATVGGGRCLTAAGEVAVTDKCFGQVFTMYLVSFDV